MDCAVPEALDTDSTYPFSGNMDVAALRARIAEAGRLEAAGIVMMITNNLSAASRMLANMRETAEVAREHGIPVVIDAARYAENVLHQRARGWPG